MCIATCERKCDRALVIFIFKINEYETNYLDMFYLYSGKWTWTTGLV